MSELWIYFENTSHEVNDRRAIDGSVKFMKCLLIGGNGFIGRHLSRILLEDGHEVSVIDKFYLESNLTQHVFDATDFNLLHQTILTTMPDWVINLAARTDPNGKKLEDYSINYEIVRNILLALEDLEVKFLHVSTQYVIAPGFGQSISKYEPYNLYGRSKVICEELILASSQDDWFIVRPTNVWGPGHPHFADGIWKQIERGLYVHPKTTVIKSYGYVETVAKQILALMCLEKTKWNKNIFYLGDESIDSYLWVNGFSQALKGRNVRRISLNKMRILGVMGSLLKMILKGFPFYWSRMNNMITPYPIDLNETLQLTQVRTPDLRSAIDETVKWYRVNKKGNP